MMLKGHLPPPEPLLALLASRLDELPGRSSNALRDFRQTAAATFGRAGIPGPRTEQWKYTPVAQMLPKSFAVRAADPAADETALADHLAPFDGVPRAVFVDGRFEPSLSALPSAENGISVRPLGAALDEEPDRLAERLEMAGSERSLSALNAALVEDGCIVDVAAGASDNRLLVVSILTGGRSEPDLFNTRHLIRIAPGADVEIGEVDLLLADTQDVVNRVVQAEIGEGARLRQERVQIGRPHARVITHFDVRLAADSRLTHGAATLGGALARNEIDASLDGPAIEATFNGLSLIGTGQHVDHALTVCHRAPSSMSDQFYKSVLDGRARSAFAGRIVVERPAQKTNAYQSNNNLLLSPDAEANAKPELEIYADDVKCSHGATAGELDERELFYLRSRGLQPDAARALLTFAFLGEVLERFEGSLVEDLVRRELLNRLGTGIELEGLVQ